MAPSRSVLVGMPAVVTAIPPGRGLSSTMPTRLPKYAARAAPFSPAGPAPITTRSYRDLTDAGSTGSPRLGAAPGQRAGSRGAGIVEDRAANAGRERAHVHHRLPAAVADLMHHVLGDHQRLAGPDLHVAVAHAHVALATEHEHDLLGRGVAVRGIRLAGKDVHEPEALLTAGSDLAVGDPLHGTPVVGDFLDVLGLADDTLDHLRPPHIRKGNGR